MSRIFAAFKHFFGLLKKTALAWNADQATTLSAALAYYTAFSIAPLLLVAIGITGLFFGEHGGASRIYGAVEQLLGPMGAKGVEALVESAAQNSGGGLVATVMGLIALVLGASGVFVQLQQSLDLIWRVQAETGRTVWSFARQRLISFSMVAVIAFLLLVSLLLSAALSAVQSALGAVVPMGHAIPWILDASFSLASSTALFAMIYKVLPDVRLQWRDVWGGSLLVSVLFSVGKTLIGVYLGGSGIASSYGAAGSFVVVLVWVYYSSMIFYFGAEFTRVSRLEGRRPVECKPIAESVERPWSASA